jgi:A/G-specific adenine glycosylase
MTRHGGRLPGRASELAALPGLGPYTAGAIASIAFAEAVPAVDGNVTRVISRLAALDGLPDMAAHRRAVATVAAGLVAGGRPGAVNQALMELGATVCAPVAPACGLCPVTAWCAAYGTGRQAELPRRRPRARPRPEHWYAYVLGECQAGTVLVARRPAAGLLGGLWAFPMLPADPAVDPVDLAAAELGLRVGVTGRLPAVGHVFTHIHLTATPVVATLREGVAALPGYVAWRQVSPAELGQLPMSTLMAKLCRAAGLVAGPPRARRTKHEAAGLPPAAPKDSAEAG